MKAIELYPELTENKEYFDAPYNYQPIVESFGKILIQVDDNDYSGDTRVLYELKGKYGILIFGWGSCSGCDALQACGSIEDIDKLIEQLSNKIKWFNSIEELKQYVKEKDWELEYSWHEEETKIFIKKVLEYEEV